MDGSNRELLEFVSWNFQCSWIGGNSVLECRTHGEIASWDGRLKDGELAMMRAIGDHMDTTGCGRKAVLATEIAETDLQIKMFRDGAMDGGATHVMITHLPTGIVVKDNTSYNVPGVLELKARMIEQLRALVAEREARGADEQG